MVKEVQRYDIRISKAEGVDEHTLSEFLRGWANKWVFQLEESDTGYVHYQGRINLIKARSAEALKKAMSVDMPKIWLAPTSNPTFQRGDFNYGMKSDTRKEGPWTDTDGPKNVTWQLGLFEAETLYPWQQKVIDIAKQWDMRKITVVIDELGDSGKSMLTEYMEYHDLGYEVPPMTQMEDIMQCCMCIKPQRCYLIDMPKGLKKDKLASFYAGIECLKNGVMYDKRYSFKKRRIDRPQIIVFTNMMPDTSLLSIDRWDFRRICGNKDLIEI